MRSKNQPELVYPKIHSLNVMVFNIELASVVNMAVVPELNWYEQPPSITNPPSLHCDLITIVLANPLYGREDIWGR